MKQPIYNDKGTQQIISTGWKTFDKQTNCITSGNAYCNTQCSLYIRPWKETECNGKENPEGYLLFFDLAPFKGYHIPPGIKNILFDKNRNDSVILYMFFTLDKDKHVQPFFWAVTSKDKKLLESKVVYKEHANYMKRVKAAREILPYICEDKDPVVY